MSGIMRRIGDDTNASEWCKWRGYQAVGIEAEVEVDVWRLRYAMAKDLIAPDRKLELDK